MWVEMIQLYADAERSVAPGQRAQFPNETAEKLIRDGAAVQVDGPQGERTQVRTRPVPQPVRGRGRAKKTREDKGEGEQGADGPGGPADPDGSTDPGDGPGGPAE